MSKRMGVFASVVLLIGLAGFGLIGPNATAVELDMIGQMGGANYAAAVAGDLLFTGIGPRLLVLDASDPNQLAELGQSEVLPGVVRALAVEDAYAYVAAGKGGLQIVDISDPAHPVVIGNYLTEGYAQDVAVASGYVYLTNTPVWDGSGWSGSGLHIVDISDPANPKQMTVYDTPGWEFGVAVVGDTVFVADGDGGLRILDVSDKTAPKEVGATYTAGYALDVAVGEGVVYVAEFDKGVGVVDVADLSNPREVKVIDTPGKARHVTVNDGTVYVGDGNGGLRILDVSAALEPVEIGAFASEDGRGVAVNGAFVYLADRQLGLHVLEVADRTSPVALSRFETVGTVRGVAADEEGGDRAYVAAGNTLYGLDMSTPERPQRLAGISLAGQVNDMAFVQKPGARGKGVLYVAEGPTWVERAWQGGGMRVFETDGAGGFQERAFFDTPGQARGVAVANGLVYLADGNAGVRVFNINKPETPHEVGFENMSGHAVDVALGQGRAHIATNGRGVDAGQANGHAISAMQRQEGTPDFARGLAVQDGMIYVAVMPDPGDPVLDGNRWPDGGLYVLDAENPAKADVARYYATPGDIENVAVSGEFVLVADGDGGLLVFQKAQ
ncbi:MAG: PQQ-binding-like beta-propeller repeat protein [Caldilineales bacterium]|nr:PQQ-binding-like beta-propeller repeat protein [Caldilineales bacterium]